MGTLHGDIILTFSAQKKDIGRKGKAKRFTQDSCIFTALRHLLLQEIEETPETSIINSPMLFNHPAKAIVNLRVEKEVNQIS